MRVAIIGSRGVTEDAYAALCEKVPVGASEIISGGASGADALAARYAAETGLPLTELRPDYAAYGRRAPLERTDRILARADYVLALWDGVSRGTAYAINACIRTYKPVRVILIKGEPHAETE